MKGRAALAALVAAAAAAPACAALWGFDDLSASPLPDAGGDAAEDADAEAGSPGCVNGDGFCPAGCFFHEDDDCPTVPGLEQTTTSDTTFPQLCAAGCTPWGLGYDGSSYYTVDSCYDTCAYDVSCEPHNTAMAFTGYGMVSLISQGGKGVPIGRAATSESLYRMSTPGTSPPYFEPPLLTIPQDPPIAFWAAIAYGHFPQTGKNEWATLACDGLVTLRDASTAAVDGTLELKGWGALHGETQDDECIRLVYGATHGRLATFNGDDVISIWDLEGNRIGTTRLIPEPSGMTVFEPKSLSYAEFPCAGQNVLWLADAEDWYTFKLPL